jgi:hypothetical protein
MNFIQLFSLARNVATIAQAATETIGPHLTRLRASAAPAPIAKPQRKSRPKGFKASFQGDTPFASAIRKGIEATGGTHGRSPSPPAPRTPRKPRPTPALAPAAAPVATQRKPRPQPAPAPIAVAAFTAWADYPIVRYRAKSVGPTCVVRFEGGETCRMTTASLPGKPLNAGRGLRLCVAAWQNRTGKKATPRVEAMTFERDGEIVGRFDPAAANANARKPDPYWPDYWQRLETAREACRRNAGDRSQLERTARIVASMTRKESANAA